MEKILGLFVKIHQVKEEEVEAGGCRLPVQEVPVVSGGQGADKKRMRPLPGYHLGEEDVLALMSPSFST